MHRNFLTRIFLALLSFLLTPYCLAVGLGNISVSSNPQKNLEAKISILMSDSEFEKLGKFNAKIADSADFVKFGLSGSGSEIHPKIFINKDSSGKPRSVVLQYDQTADALEKAFHDVVIELSWSSGKVLRVYTLLDPNSKEIQVQPGDSVISISSQIAPSLAGVEMDQLIVALYRLNPKAFFSGNIHRLKQGESLKLPSASMAASIPEQEARDFVSRSNRDFLNGQLDRSSDSGVAQSNRTYSQSKIKDDLKDRLKIGSSQTDSEQAVNQAKLNEQMIAQQKMLEEAQQRIAELEKNISELKELNTRKNSLVDKSIVDKFTGLPLRYLVIIFAVTFLVVLFLYSIFYRKKQDDLDIKIPPSPLRLGIQSFSNNSSQGELSADSLTHSVEKTLLDQRDSNEMSSEPSIYSNDEIPAHVKELFNSINLDLPSVSQSVDSDSITFLTSDEQRVRLNLARSYIKIKDIDTAKNLLNDLVFLQNGHPEVITEAKKLLQEIS
jgi:pilus assembly protein FimV